VADPRPMTEAQLQAAVVRLCKLYGLKWHHQKYSIGSGAGWPDLTIAGRSLLFRELKREDGKVTRAQHDWGITLGIAGQDWDTWRPSDLASGRIQRELEALR
jgi:hypothetical protein